MANKFVENMDSWYGTQPKKGNSLKKDIVIGLVWALTLAAMGYYLGEWKGAYIALVAGIWTRLISRV